MLVIVGERTAQAFARVAPLVVLALSFKTPKVTTAMLWHRRSDESCAHRWLRTKVMSVVHAL